MVPEVLCSDIIRRENGKDFTLTTGLMALRAGLPANHPMSIMNVEGGMAFGRLTDALAHLRDTVGGRGLVVALQRGGGPFMGRSQSGSPTGEVLTGRFSRPVSLVDVTTTSNFLSLLGSGTQWYWEDELGSEGTVRHRWRTETQLRNERGWVIFVVIPNAPSISPIPGELLSP